MDETRLAQLRDFIIDARKEGETYDVIRQQLLSSGWSDADVNDYLPTAWQQAEAMAAPAPPPAQPPAVEPVYAPPVAEAKPEAPAYTPPPVVATPPAYPPTAQPGYGGLPQQPPTYAAAAEPPAYGIGAWFQRGWAMFSSDAGTMIGAFLVTVLLGIITVGILMPPLLVGFTRMLLKKYDGQPIAFNDIFEGLRFFWSAWGVVAIMVLANMVIAGPIGALTGGGRPSPGEAMSAGMAVGQGLTTIWGWVVGTFFLFALPFVADGRGGAIEAVTASFKTALSDFGIYFVMSILTQVAAAVGVILCFVGILASAPWAQATLVSVYRSRFPAVR